MLQQSTLRRPRVIRARDQIAVDLPGRRLVEGVAHLSGVTAGQSQADRQIAPRLSENLPRAPRQIHSSSAMPSVKLSPDVAARISPSIGKPA